MKNNVSYTTTALAVAFTVTGLEQTTRNGASNDEHDEIVSTAHSRIPTNLDTPRHDDVASNTDEYEEYKEYILDAVASNTKEYEEYKQYVFHMLP